MKRDCIVIVENALKRYQRSDFLTGDYVVFKKDALKSDWAKELSDAKKAKLQEMIDSGNNLRVSAVKSSHIANGHTDYSQQANNFYIDITVETAPGLYTGFITVPEELIEVKDYYPNMGPIPDHQKRPDGSHIKPEEHKYEGPAADSTKTTEGDKSLTTKNIKIPGGNKYKDTAPGSGTHKYLEKMK